MHNSRDVRCLSWWRLRLIAWIVIPAVIVPSARAAFAVGLSPMQDHIGQAQRRAVEQVLASARSTDPFLRTNAMEACEYLEVRRAMPLLQLALEDETEPVRFAALVMIGRLELKPQVASARRLLASESAAVRAAALFALRRCGEPVDLTPMAQMLASDGPGLRGNVAMLVGMMGDPSAVPMLKDRARVPLPATTGSAHEVIVRIQMAEACVRLGDDSALSMIRWGLYSTFVEVRVLAAMMLGRIGDHKMEEALFSILHDTREPIELRLAAMDAVVRMSKAVQAVNEVLESLDVVLDATRSESANVRSLAAHTLRTVEAARRRYQVYLEAMEVSPPTYVVKRFANEAVAKALPLLLGDESEQVRLAAAAAILALPATRAALP